MIKTESLEYHRLFKLLSDEHDRKVSALKVVFGVEKVESEGNVLVRVGKVKTVTCKSKTGKKFIRRVGTGIAKSEFVSACRGYFRDMGAGQRFTLEDLRAHLRGVNPLFTSAKYETAICGALNNAKIRGTVKKLDRRDSGDKRAFFYEKV